MRLRLIARLDYDTREALREGIERMRFLMSLPHDPGVWFTMRRHRTARGWHVEVYGTLKLDAGQMVALQAVLGSDFRREAFNLYRVTRLPDAPKFWRRLGNWNVLHAQKL